MDGITCPCLECHENFYQFVIHEYKSVEDLEQMGCQALIVFQITGFSFQIKVSNNVTGKQICNQFEYLV